MMKYMTFNSSCSYAGVANMLAQYGVETDDRAIAMGMKLPCLFAYADGTYLAGPMLQSGEWFDLYLNTIGYHMAEWEVPASQAVEYLKQQKTAMLGLQVDENGKHAVVYTGTQDGKLVFLNNKWEQDPAPEKILLTETELLERIGASAVIATLEPTEPKTVELAGKIEASVTVLRQNLAEVRAVCARAETVGNLRAKLNTLFRPLLLDGVTMLGLLGETDLAQRFGAVQGCFLTALRQNGDTVITLGDHLPMEELAEAVEAYIRIIKGHAGDGGGKA